MNVARKTGLQRDLKCLAMLPAFAQSDWVHTNTMTVKVRDLSSIRRHDGKPNPHSQRPGIHNGKVTPGTPAAEVLPRTSDQK